MFWLGRFFWLMVAHALTDYALQSPDLGILKNPDYSGPQQKTMGPWWWHMTAHALINGGGVALVTGNWILGVLETILHFTLDTLKCKGILDTHGDQYGHIASKVIWASLY